MKWYVFTILAPAMLLSQPPQRSTSATYTYDPNGNAIAAGERQQVISKDGSSSVQMLTTLNGNVAPLEKVEEKLISKTENSKVVERVVVPYDTNGNPGQTRKIVTTERKNYDGSTSVEVSSYRADLNGSFALGEKELKVTRKTGANTSVFEKTVVRSTLNGEELVERQVGNVVATKNLTKEDVAIERRDLNGSLQPAGRVLMEKLEKDGTVKETSTTYTQDGAQLQLAKQTVSETKQNKDGSSVTKVDVFGTNTPGRYDGGGLQFREQQIIDRSPDPSGALKEVFSIRRPTLDGGNVLGPVLKISERNCTGQCNNP